MSKLLDFLFGKSPKIFDEMGRVRHNFPEEKWQQWNNRLLKNPEYDWKNHTAKENAKKPDTSKKS